MIEVGDQAPDQSGYYLRLAGNDAVYLSKTDMDNFFCGQGDFIGLNLIDSATETQTVALGDITLSGTIRSTPFTLTANKSGHTVPLGGGYEAGGENYSALISNLSALTASGAIMPHPDEEALSEYGLNSPRSVVTFTRTVEEDGESSSEEYTISLGNKENSYYFAMISGIDAVYMLPDTAVTWAELTMEDFVSTQPITLSASDLASFSVESDSVRADFAVTAEDGEITAVTSSWNEIDPEQFQNLYLSFQALNYISYQDQKPDGETLAHIAITDVDGNQYSFTLIRSSSRSVYVDTGGSGGFLIREADTETFLQRVQMLLDGEEVPSGY